MERKKYIILTILIGALGSVGCNNLNSNDLSNEEIESSSTPYLIDTSLDDKEHTYNKEETRAIIEAFNTINQAMSPDRVQQILEECGTFTKSEIYTIEPSEYELFDVKVVNDNNEDVCVTFKDGRVLYKQYHKDTNNELNQNFAFVNYDSVLYKQNYSSGIYTDVVDKNIAENKNVWEIEEDVFKIFN